MNHDASVQTMPDAEAVGLTLQLVAATYRSPEAPLQADLASGALQEALDALAAHAGVDAPQVGAPDWALVQSSYVDLFVSSVRRVVAPPYVGFAIDGELLGPSVDTLKAFLAHHGVEVAAGWHDLPDHVAAVAEAGALLQGAGRDDAACVLLARFLSPWFERYAPEVVAADVSGFYGPLTEFLGSLVNEVACEAAA
jgi:putative dimethyl sulfoxide reductase chaperone